MDLKILRRLSTHEAQSGFLRGVCWNMTMNHKTWQLDRPLTAPVMGPVYQDWTKEEIKEVYDMPMLELLYRASSVHRMFFDPTEVQQCTLLSIKTGGCTEDCGYCSQSVRHKTFVKPTPQMKVRLCIDPTLFG